MKLDFSSIFAGGMTLIPSIKQGLSSPTDLIDLTNINDINGITENITNISIGSLVNHNEIANSNIIKNQLP